jgi:HlyD family secretion protein
MTSLTVSKTRVWLRVVVVLLLVALIGWWALMRSQSGTVVRIAVATRQGLTATSSTNGIVEPVQEFEAHSPLSTVVKAIYVKEGDHVSAGKLLLTLDDAAAQAALAQADASVKGAEASLSQLKQGGSRSDQVTLAGRTSQALAEQAAAARDLATLQALAAKGDASNAEVLTAQQRLDSANATVALNAQHKTDTYSPPDLAHAQAALEEARAAYSAAADTVAKANVRAPFAGTVFSLQVHTTQFVQAGDKMLELADLSKLQVRAYYDEPELGKIAVGQPAIFKWAAKPDREWHGRVVQMPSTIVHYGTRNVGEVVVSVDDPDGVLLSSTNVTVTLTTTQHANALTIPREALRLDGRGNYVYVVHDGKLSRSDVKTGAVNVSQAEVTSGLSDGQSVVLDAVDGSPLKDGMAVQAAK